VQVATFLLLASGMPFILGDDIVDQPRFDGHFRLRFGFEVLKWIVLICLPSFFAFGIGLSAYEIYYELSTTSGKGKKFVKLLASLRVPGRFRTLKDIQNIHAAIIASEFLKPYSYSKLVTICRACGLLELQPHEAVFSEGDTGDQFLVLIKGTVDVYVKEKTPPHTMKCVNTLHDSGSFGELALLQVMHPLLLFSASTMQGHLSRFLQESGKRTASVISKTEAVLITIHRDAFQHMIAGSDADAGSDAELVPISSGSIAYRALCTLRAIGGQTINPLAMPRSPSDRTKQSELSPHAPDSLKKQGTLMNLKDNFGASQMSRTDVAYNPDVTSTQRLLLERAMTARATMKAWCDLRGMAPMAFVTMPLPEPLQELQVRTCIAD
jgi:CRP-like cAMP-binding protein